MALNNSILALIGKTPLVELQRYATDMPGRIAVKLESFNPGGSVKDRIALAMVEAAEREGELRPGGTIVEPTSGNTGIGLAMVAAAKGLKAVLVMPDSMSVERRQLLVAYGAELVLTPREQGMNGAIAKAVELAETNGWFMPQQFENPANTEVHRLTTGEEIWQDSNGEVAALVSGVGTGGTVTGAGAALRSHNKDIWITAVEPADSAVLSGGPAAPHPIQGLGAGFIPKILNTEIYNEVIRVEARASADAARKLATSEGILAGISSGAALVAAIEVASRPEFADKLVVAVLPDTGERYLSTHLFDPTT